MKEQIIQLDPHDDAVSVREKLGWVQATHVLLVFPDDPRQQVLQRKLDLVLIQREATRLHAQLALITRDPLITEHARELGIACFNSIEASHRSIWRSAEAQIAVRQAAERMVTLDQELVEAGSRLQRDSQPLPAPISRTTLRVLAGSVAGLVLVGIYVILPGATVYLTPAANQVTVTTTVTADPNFTGTQAESNIIPARIVGVEVEGQTNVSTTGTIDQPSEKARGIALFTNLIPDQVTIPAGTVVRTSAAQPVRFLTLADATLPGSVGETVEVPIEAIEPGYEGNLPTGRINQIEGPLASRLAVANPDPTRGGDVTVVPAISPQDYDRVRTLLLQVLQQRAFAAMQTDPYIALLDTEFIPLESLTVVLIHSETYDGYIGQAANQLSLTMRVTVQGIAIDERRAREAVYTGLAEKVGDGFEIQAASLIFRRGEVTGIDDQQRVTFIMQGAGDVSAAIRPTEVRRMIQGKPINDALAQLDRELALAEPPTVEMWPPFWPLMPTLAGRITIRVAEQP